MANASTQTTALGTVRDNLDLVLVFAIIGILIAIFVPLPTWIIDMLLVANITISIVVLLTSIYVREPLEFSVFPSLLLVTTVYRLALNVATTRLTLSNAKTHGTEAAGQVIAAFGDFVAGREPVIGFIIFLILVIVQFVVITKGATRISEVAARFTLDAMPGKQMAIDADLNAGLIKEAEARQRRQHITREADFYGAMDGASKFVRGDAIAGILITIVNIVGGFILGYLKYGMRPGEALHVFTLLTVGDGLVSQIPALMISVAAGLIVTRATAVSNLGSDLMTQVFSSSRALWVSAGFLGLLVLTPMPTVPLLLVALLVGFVARTLGKVRAEAVAEDKKQKTRDLPRKPEKVEALLHIDPMELEVGYGLVRLVDPNQGGDLVERITMIRRQLALDLGIVLPPVRIRDNGQLGHSEYIIKIRGVEVARGSVLTDHFMAIDSGVARGKVEGIATREPAFGNPAWWITESQKQRAEALGFNVYDPATVLATHLTEVIKGRAAEMLTREDAHALLQNLKETAKTLVEEVVPNLLKPGDVQKVLQNLLREGVSIRDLAAILETLGDYAARTKDPEILTEYCRHALARAITQSHLGKDGKLHVVTLDPRLEDLIKGATERSEAGSFLTLPPKTAQKLVQRIAAEVRRLAALGHSAVILSAPQVRLQVKRLADSVQAGVAVLSFNEIARDAKVESHGMIAEEGTA